MRRKESAMRQKFLPGVRAAFTAGKQEYEWVFGGGVVSLRVHGHPTVGQAAGHTLV